METDSAIAPLGEDIGVDTDHTGLNKCADRNDQLYKKLCVALKKVNNPVLQGQVSRIAKARQLHSIVLIANTDNDRATFMVPFARDHEFVERKQIFDQLDRGFSRPDAHLRVALHGIGGVG